jgi:hypothetical protein
LPGTLVLTYDFIIDERTRHDLVQMQMRYHKRLSRQLTFRVYLQLPRPLDTWTDLVDLAVRHRNIRDSTGPQLSVSNENIILQTFSLTQQPSEPESIKAFFSAITQELTSDIFTKTIGGEARDMLIADVNAPVGT